MQQALQAADELEGLEYRVNIWSITSFTELEREVQACTRWNRLHPQQVPRQSYVSQLFAKEQGVFVIVTDYMKSLANGIIACLPGPCEILVTDGYGLSESRQNLRDFFEIGERYIVQAALSLLYRSGAIDEKCLKVSGVNVNKSDPRTRAIS